MKQTGSENLKNSLGFAFLLVWAVLSTLIIGLQMARHSVSMPLPANVDRFIREMVALNTGESRDWININIVYEHCSCTNSLLKHLVERGPATDAREMILIVGAEIPYESELRSAGYIISKIDRDQFVEKFGIEAAPLFTVLDRAGKLRYLGGYFTTSAAANPMDEEIIRGIREGHEVSALPLYGCALSRRLRKYLDPLGLEG